MGGQLTPKIHWTKTNMQRFALLVIASVAAASPIEDTADVAAAKAEFNAAFARAEAGRHIELAPMNNDVQAAPIATAYLADSDDVAAAKAEFKAAFENVAAGGLADMQEPAPVHKLPAVPPVHLHRWRLLPIHHLHPACCRSCPCLRPRHLYSAIRWLRPPLPLPCRPCTCQGGCCQG